MITFRVVLGCEGLNLWGILQLGKQETRNLMSSVSLLLDIADLTLNASLQLTYDDGKIFECSNNPTNDYYNLTKNLNVIATATKVYLKKKLNSLSKIFKKQFL